MARSINLTGFARWSINPVINLNKIIDRNQLSHQETETSNLKHRPIGVGSSGTADVFTAMGVSFDEESFEIERTMFRVIYHTAMSTSIDLAVKFGSNSFEGSPPRRACFNQFYGRIPTSKGTAPSSHPPTGRISVLSRIMDHANLS
jgi:ribonucleotide reductase alpha subunit